MKHYMATKDHYVPISCLATSLATTTQRREKQQYKNKITGLILKACSTVPTVPGFGPEPFLMSSVYFSIP